MLECAEKESLVGGTVLEVGKQHSREVAAFNDPGPDRNPGVGTATSNASEGDRMVWNWLADDNIWTARNN
ncbi:15-hydroxyprostaglandin dehydrogenase [NAD(+)] [Tolypocladium capitatum]|uniref:15-hydroxyprostaglandin dehydrogenase [NAD(+)] n=1 Tax=Tolypocladium capitatum TaxID=45235 RepID=A0A2K3QAT6_9HYPO|nr:15-hydroxyprostaglandin dehydrogenase [NAD(+)] [Tolypocladium capitatum]